MDTDQIMRLIYLSLFLVAIGGSFLVSNRNNLGKTAQQAAIWVLIFVGVIGAYGLWDDVRNDATGRQSYVGADRIEVPRQLDGHYYLTLEINDVPVDFVVDTGATQMVLTQKDAQRVGLNPDTLGYYGTASTANGVVNTAPVWLDRVALGEFRDRDVPAVVNEGDLFESLLGMEYLELYDRIEIAGNQLVLTR